MHWLSVVRLVRFMFEADLLSFKHLKRTIRTIVECRSPVCIDAEKNWTAGSAYIKISYSRLDKLVCFAVTELWSIGSAVLQGSCFLLELRGFSRRTTSRRVTLSNDSFVSSGRIAKIWQITKQRNDRNAKLPTDPVKVAILQIWRRSGHDRNHLCRSFLTDDCRSCF